MGAWGFRAFENDEALDWAARARELGIKPAVESALDAVLGDASRHPDESASSVACAAAALVACKNGYAQSDVPEDLISFVQESSPPGPELIQKAHAALTRILESSELKDLWAETEYLEPWVSDLNAIRQRLVVRG